MLLLGRKPGKQYKILIYTVKYVFVQENFLYQMVKSCYLKCNVNFHAGFFTFLS